MNNYEKVVNLLIEKNKTVSTMESCTGGLLASSITNIDNSSSIFKFGAVTYSNEYKIKMGVSSAVIDKYTVYSAETAREMSRAITDYTGSNYGVGVTGQINKQDPNNPYGSVGEVFISIYDKGKNMFYEYDINTDKSTRKENKVFICDYTIERFLDIINKE